MTILLPQQADALRSLHRLFQSHDIDIIVIGAIAFRVWFPDEYRLTGDIDVAVAIDLDELPTIARHLEAQGWRADRTWEPQWHSPEGARIDILPVGRRALKEGEMTWPRAGTTMNVVGYARAFEAGIVRELATGLAVRVAPLHVLALLKIAAYLDDPQGRQKDLGDILTILERYEEGGDRRFGDDILDASIEYEEAGAFLLGRDLRARCSAPRELDVVRRFIGRSTESRGQIPIQLLGGLHRHDRLSDGLLERRFAALASGFGHGDYLGPSSAS